VDHLTDPGAVSREGNVQIRVPGEAPGVFRRLCAGEAQLRGIAGRPKISAVKTSRREADGGSK